jgi:hypothetical protein
MPVKHLRYRYKHMVPAHQRIWERFLEQYGDYFDSFEYDMRVGVGIGDVYGYDEMTTQIAKALTQKRIDAVGRRGSEVWLFEIKPQAGLSAIGQVLAYKTLYEKEFGVGSVHRIAIVTDRTDIDESTVCEEYNIRIYEVG